MFKIACLNFVQRKKIWNDFNFENFETKRIHLFEIYFEGLFLVRALFWLISIKFQNFRKKNHLLPTFFSKTILLVRTFTQNSKNSKATLYAESFILSFIIAMPQFLAMVGLNTRSLAENITFYIQIKLYIFLTLFVLERWIIGLKLVIWSVTRETRDACLRPLLYLVKCPTPSYY